MTYAEAYVPGELADEVLFSTYVCHPSLCNDNLSGVVLTAALAKYLRPMRFRYSYRFLLGPGTIGPLSWLWKNEASLDRVKHGPRPLLRRRPGPAHVQAEPPRETPRSTRRRRTSCGRPGAP